MKLPAFLPRCLILFSVVVILSSQKLQAQLTYNELSVQYDSPWTFKKLQLIPIRFKGPGAGNMDQADHTMFGGNIFSFSEAMDKHKITVKELTSGGADVSTLMIKNHSQENIMLMSGEMVQG